MATSRPSLRVKSGVLEQAKRQHAAASDEALAALIGVSRATYTRVKTGELSPSPVFMAGLVRLTGRSLGQLFEVEPEPAKASA